MPAIEVYPQYTNIVRFKLAGEVKISAEELVDRLSEKGVRIGNGGPWGMRAVTHYWIDDEATKATIQAFESILNVG
jgi:hypothetical protein